MPVKGSRIRFDLSRFEIAGLVVSSAASFLMVFLLGVYAGRGMTERRLGEGQQIVRLPVASTEEAHADEPGLTFDDVLAGGPKEVKREPRPPQPPKEKAEAPPIVPPKVAARPAPVVEAKPAAAPPPEPKRVVAAATPTKPERAAAPAPVPKEPARVAVAIAKPDPPVPPRTDSAGRWTVQVAAARDPRTADGLVSTLKSRGYEAYVVKVRRAGETLYRVRVGRYGSIEAAQGAVAGIRRVPGVQGAFVASD